MSVYGDQDQLFTEDQAPHEAPKSPFGGKNMEEAERLLRVRDQLELKEIMSEASGRWFVWRILTRARAFQLGYSGPDDSYRAYREGQRDIGLSLLSDVLTVDPNLFTIMQREAQQVEEYFATMKREGEDDG